MNRNKQLSLKEKNKSTEVSGKEMVDLAKDAAESFKGKDQE